MLDDLLVQVPVIAVLHDDASNSYEMVLEGLPQRIRPLLEEHLFVHDHVRVSDGGQDPDLIQSVLLFLF